MHVATLLVVLLAWGGIALFASQSDWIPAAAVEDITGRGFDVAATAVFLYFMDKIVQVIAADVSVLTSTASVSAAQHERIMEKLVERTEEVKILQRMLGSRKRNKAAVEK